jgi:hypothetical protein
MQTVVSLAFITAVLFGFNDGMPYGDATGFRTLLAQETQQTQQQNPALYPRLNAQPNYHHHCTMILEPFVFP